MKTKLHITHIRPSTRRLRPYGTYCYEAILLDKHDVIWTGERHDTEDEALEEAKAELDKRLQTTQVDAYLAGKTEHPI